eukprot:sb/3473231/
MKTHIPSRSTVSNVTGYQPIRDQKISLFCVLYPLSHSCTHYILSMKTLWNTHSHTRSGVAIFSLFQLKLKHTIHAHSLSHARYLSDHTAEEGHKIPQPSRSTPGTDRNNQSELVIKITLTGYQPIRDQYFLIRSVPAAHTPHLSKRSPHREHHP